MYMNNTDENIDSPGHRLVDRPKAIRMQKGIPPQPSPLVSFLTPIARPIIAPL